jgi:hypothetical protein
MVPGHPTPAGTTATICVAVAEFTVAGMPPKVTTAPGKKLVPVIVTHGAGGADRGQRIR